MQLKMSCSDCGKVIAFKPEYAGKKAKCPHCAAPVVLQAAANKPRSAPAAKQPPAQAETESEPEPSENFSFEPSPEPTPPSPTPARATTGIAPTKAPGVAARPAPAAKQDAASDGTNVSMLVSGAIAAVVTILLFAALYPLKDYFIGKLFWERGRVPFPVTLFGMWALTIVAMKYSILRKQRLSLNVDILPTSIAEVIRPQHVPAFRKHISELPAALRQTLFVDRVERGLEHFESRSNVSEVAQVLESQAAIDAGNVESSFTIVKVFIWAIPILGFIGTVLGISEAVGGFAETIQAAQALDVIKTSLGEVTSGLALAFDTTLLALLFSILVMFPMSSMQKSEEMLLGEIEEYCNETVLRRLDDGHHEGASNAAEIKAAVGEALAEQDAQFLMWKEQLANIGRSATDQIAEGIAAVHARLLKDYESQMLVVQQRAAQERDSMVTMVKEIQELQINRFNQAIEEMARLHAELRDEHEQQSQAIYNSTGESRRLFFEQLQAAQQEHLGHFERILEASRATSTETGQQLESWQQDQLQQLTASQQQFGEHLAAMRQLLEQQPEVQRLQNTLNENLTALHASEQFSTTLGDLSQALTQLQPVLQQLEQSATAQANQKLGGWSLFGRKR